MSGRRIKNLILLILALAVCFLLLAVVPGKLSAQREESALHRGLTELLASYGVSIDPALLTPGETLYAIELGEADASAAAEALLGEAAEADSSSTRYEILYSADSGSVSFSRSGALHAELSAAVGGRSYEQDMQRRLRGMGYTVWADAARRPAGRRRLCAGRGAGAAGHAGLRRDADVYVSGRRAARGRTGSSTPNPDLLPASRRRRASPAPTR